MSYSHVQYLAFERRKIINHAIRIILENYPDNTWAGDGKPADVAPITTFRRIVTAFFLTDHLVDSDGEESEQSSYFGPQVMYSSNSNIAKSKSIDASASMDEDQVLSFDEERVNGNDNDNDNEEIESGSESTPTSHEKEANQSSEHRDSVPEIVPMSSQKRQSTVSRREMEKEMKHPSLLENPIMLPFLFFMTMQFFMIVPRIVIQVNSDIAMVILLGTFMIGRKSVISGSDDMELAPGDDGVNTRHSIQEDSTRLLRVTLANADRSNVVRNEYTPQQKESPFNKFPDGAPIGSIRNCWSEPTYNEFRVRGKDYLTDRLKVTSGPFLFPLRGVDMFLSDCCPEHIAR
jgi:hypothetical protein